MLPDFRVWHAVIRQTGRELASHRPVSTRHRWRATLIVIDHSPGIQSLARHFSRSWPETTSQRHCRRRNGLALETADSAGTCHCPENAQQPSRSCWTGSGQRHNKASGTDSKFHFPGLTQWHAVALGTRRPPVGIGHRPVFGSGVPRQGLRARIRRPRAGPRTCILPRSAYRPSRTPPTTSAAGEPREELARSGVSLESRPLRA